MVELLLDCILVSIFEKVKIMKYDLDRLSVETLSEKARTNYVWINGVYLPEEYKLIADAVENFEVNDDDVWVCSFQKSGKNLQISIVSSYFRYNFFY